MLSTESIITQKHGRTINPVMDVWLSGDFDSPGHKLIALYLSEQMVEYGEVFLSPGHIAYVCCLSSTTARAAMEDLCKAGFLKYTNKKWIVVTR